MTPKTGTPQQAVTGSVLLTPSKQAFASVPPIV